MRLQHKFFMAIILIALLFCTNAEAQQLGDEMEEKRFAQFTFIYPIGSNGQQSSITTNNVSLNVLMGMSGGVNGIEIGGLHNTTKGDVTGFQLGGLGNVTTGITRGFQLGGLYNIDGGLTTGVQFAGITNVINGPSKGVHFSGITNIVNKESWAFQASGLTNITPEGNHGMQIAGISNLNGKAGEGAQLSGIVNISQGKRSKFQAAGLVNISTESVEGVQLSGFLNYAKRLNGFQLSLINIADTVERGVPLGLISVVKNGYYAFEIEANEAFWINATYKMGVPKLYNIFTIGFKQQDSKEMWGVGLGLGSLVPIGKAWGVNIDLTATHVNENEWWTNELNLLNRLKINAWIDLGPIQIYGGPSLNVHVSNLKNNEGQPGGNLIDPELSFYNEIHGNTRTIVYPGFNLGIRF